MKRELIIFWILLCLAITGHADNEVWSFRIYTAYSPAVGGFIYNPPAESAAFVGLPYVVRLKQQDIIPVQIEIDGLPYSIEPTRLDYWNTSDPNGTYPKRYCFIEPLKLNIPAGIHTLRGYPGYDGNWTQAYLLNVWTDGQCRLMRAGELTLYLEINDFLEAESIADIVMRDDRYALHLSKRIEQVFPDDLSYIYETLNTLQTDQMLIIVKRPNGYAVNLLERGQLLFLSDTLNLKGRLK